MITGAISGRRAYLDLLVRGPGGHQAQVEFVLDTGFTAAITLPPDACSALGLTLLRSEPAGLADGSRVMLEVYEATLLWDGDQRQVEALALPSAPLIGMTQLEGSDVHLQIAQSGDGVVTIEPL
jgi:clan AA aspartic protease